MKSLLFKISIVSAIIFAVFTTSIFVEKVLAVSGGGVNTAAPGGGVDSVGGGNGQLFNYFGSGSTLDSVLSKIIDYFIGVSVSVAVIIVIYGAWKMMTATGDPKKFQEGQKTVLYAAIGLLVILLARGIIGALYGIIQTL
ncbi:MAG: hypothetical protein NUV83_00890 [Candidatus Wolfebacteria bacterium]|nr:hypothetical protein [Candidatus Wolfebacteria bacterium]